MWSKGERGKLICIALHVKRYENPIWKQIKSLKPERQARLFRADLNLVTEPSLTVSYLLVKDSVDNIWYIDRRNNSFSCSQTQTSSLKCNATESKAEKDSYE